MNLPHRCILIDDDPLNNLIAKKIISLVSPDIDVVSFTDPIKGLAYMQYELPIATKKVVAFIDISMPVMDGFELLRQLEISGAGHLPLVSIFMLSSSMNHADIQRANSSPMVVQFVEKPLSPDLISRCFDMT
jgi:CheY-like chemotaxis protein